MAASAYCTAADVYRALPRGGLPNPPRLVADVDSGAEVFELDGHGFEDDDELTFRAEGGGSVPAPLIAGTTYYAIVVSERAFSVAATAGGAAIDLTSPGSRVTVSTPVPMASWIKAASALIDDRLPAHLVPLDAPYPQSVIDAAAALAADRGLRWAGARSEQQETGAIKMALDQLDRWVKGAPIRGPIVPHAANLATSASAAALDPRGWAPNGQAVLP